jgi:phage gp29-like protein
LNTPSISPEYIPEFDFKKSAIDETAQFIQTVQMVVNNLGLEVSEAQVREYTGLREPAEGEKTISPQIQPSPEEMMSTSNPQAQPAARGGNGNGANNNRNSGNNRGNNSSGNNNNSNRTPMQRRR